MTSDIIRIENITLEYNSRAGLFKKFTHKALKDVSFSVKKGEILGILGKNGCGKSSLLQILAGILQPDSGKIILNKATTRSLLTLGLGFNPQLSGRDNALISCMLNGFSKKHTISKLEDIKEFSELGKFFEQPVKTYSAGMRARLGFATGILTDVDVLLIDETLSVGDQEFKLKAQQTLQEKINGDQTVIFVSHSIHQIKSICDRCIWLEDGVIKLMGTTDEILPKYIKH